MVINNGNGGMSSRPRIGISSCLLGNKVRYDGGHKFDSLICNALGQHVQFVPVCPEVECGLPVPREPIRLTGKIERPRLVAVESGVDHSARMRHWVAQRLSILEREQLSGFIFKKSSPSCGLLQVKVYGPQGGFQNKGVGIFAQAFIRRFPHLPAEEAERLHDPWLGWNFSARIFALQRLRALRDGEVDPAAFHTCERLLLLAHSPAHCRTMDALVTSIGRVEPKLFLRQYVKLFAEALARPATKAQNLCVLQHIQNILHKKLPACEQKELTEMFDACRAGRLPLIMLVMQVRRLAEKYGPAGLAEQSYLNPHPVQNRLLQTLGLYT